MLSRDPTKERSVMIQHANKPNPGIVLDLLQAFRSSKVMFAAVSLGIFDVLSASPKSLEVLANELKLNTDAVERLLDACVGLGLLGQANQRYMNSAAATAYLCNDSPHRMT